MKERLPDKEVMTFVVKCANHGVLGVVYSARAGMSLFEGHRQMMTDECGGVEIYPNKPQIIKDERV